MRGTNHRHHGPCSTRGNFFCLIRGGSAVGGGIGVMRLVAACKNIQN